MSTVIIVDDQPINRAVLKIMLESSGAEVLEATDGVEGLALLNRARCDLLLADLHMPRMDGVQMVRQMRSGAGPNREVVVVAVTADTTVGARELAGLGFDGYLAKPISMANVRAALEMRRRPTAPPIAGAC
jgi:CheY-like chemotaxis protein